MATADFPTSGSPTLVQSGNVDPGPGVHAWMPAVTVDAAGHMAIGFAIGGPNQYYGAGFTGRLGGDPAGTVIAPETTYATGLGNYVRTDGGGRNRWGDYSGIAIDPSDQAPRDKSQLATLKAEKTTECRLQKHCASPRARQTSRRFSIASSRGNSPNRTGSVFRRTAVSTR